jgi:hypothetical protein
MNSEFIRRNFLNFVGVKRPPEFDDLRTRVYRLRDSISYRATSVVWHLTVLSRAREDARRRLNTSAAAALEGTSSPMAALNFMRSQFFLFDDVVFNTLSLYDYLSRLIGAVRRFPTGRQLWAEMVKDCRKKPSRIPPRVAELVIQTHETWVNELDRFRGQAIHEEAKLGRGQTALDLDTMQAAWHVWVPVELQAFLRPITTPEDAAGHIDLVDGATALVTRAFTDAAAILRSIGDACPIGENPTRRKKRGAGLPP